MKKQNKINHSRQWSALAVLAIVVIAATAVGLVVCYDKLRDLWLEQCVIADMAAQVSVTSGKMVKADVLAEEFGLRTGANLALIDFDVERKRILETIPNLKEITVTRHLPDRVTIVAEERRPVARLNVVKIKADSGKVVDDEGVVFMWQRGTRQLPVIRERSAPGTRKGARLTGRPLSALRLVEAWQDVANAPVGILEVDVSQPDYLLATLSNYSMAKIAWEGMDGPADPQNPNLARILKRLAQALATRLGDGALIWNATDTSSNPNIYADGKGKF